MKCTLGELLLPQPKSKIKAGDGEQTGPYNFYTSSQTLSKYYHTATYTEPALIFGTGGMASVHYCDQPFSTSTDCLVMYGCREANLELIYHYLRTNMHILQAGFKGCGLQHISKDYILNVEIDMPDSVEQKKIVCQMTLLDKLIALQESRLASLDELVKSRFVEMFGDLVIGDKVNTSKKRIGEIASVTKLAGFEFTKYIQYKEQGDVIMLRGLNCKNGRLILDDIKWIDKKTSDLLPRSKLYYGDILMTYAGTIGDVAMVDADDKYHLAPNVAKISLNDKNTCNPVFLMHLFMYTNNYIMTFASVVAQASINMEKIRNFEYYFPPIEQQNQFAAFVAQIDKSKLAVKRSLEQLETLKKSLMQEYFG